MTGLPAVHLPFLCGAISASTQTHGDSIAPSPGVRPTSTLTLPQNEPSSAETTLIRASCTWLRGQKEELGGGRKGVLQKVASQGDLITNSHWEVTAQTCSFLVKGLPFP